MPDMRRSTSESSVAYSQGIQFFHVYEKIWLAETVPQQYLEIATHFAKKDE